MVTLEVLTPTSMTLSEPSTVVITGVLAVVEPSVFNV